MPKKSSRKAVDSSLSRKRSRRVSTAAFKREAVALLLEGHSAASVAERLGLSNPHLPVSRDQFLTREIRTSCRTAGGLGSPTGSRIATSHAGA